MRSVTHGALQRQRSLGKHLNLSWSSGLESREPTQLPGTAQPWAVLPVLGTGLEAEHGVARGAATQSSGAAGVSG